MKRIAMIMILLLTLLALAGCSTGNVDSQKTDDDRMFMVISYREYDGEILVDKATGVMYWKSASSYNWGSLTLLVNPDGTPRIWEG